MREQLFQNKYYSYLSELSSLYIKLALYYFVLFVDLILSSFIEATTSINTGFDTDTSSILWMSIIQIVTIFLLFVLFCTLIWQTQPLKLGLLLYILKEFVWVFISFIVMFGLTIGERIIRMNAFNQNKKNYDSAIWDNQGYSAVYYLRYLFQPLFYVIIIKGSLEVIKPKYHMQNTALWLI